MYADETGYFVGFVLGDAAIHPASYGVAVTVKDAGDLVVCQIVAEHCYQWLRG
jgi:hydrogenase/urease accessory protein HupE